MNALAVRIVNINVVFLLVIRKNNGVGSTVVLGDADCLVVIVHQITVHIRCSLTVKGRLEAASTDMRTLLCGKNTGISKVITNINDDNTIKRLSENKFCLLLNTILSKGTVLGVVSALANTFSSILPAVFISIL